MTCTGCPYFTCALICAVVFGGTVAVHVLSWYHTETTEDLFDFERQDLWELHHVAYFPTKWLSYIWAGVYFNQLLWLLYALTFACRGKGTAELLCSVVPCGTYFLLVLAFGAIAGWLFLWDRKPDRTEYSVLCLLGACVFSFVALGVTISRLRQNHEDMRLNASCDLWTTRVLVQNGIAGLAAWVTVVVFHGVAVIILEETTVELSTIQYVFMGVLLVYAIIWFAMDILGEYTIVVITPYIVIVTTLVAMALEGADKRKDTQDDIRFFICVILAAVTGVLLLLKLAISCGREKRINTIERRTTSRKTLANGGPAHSL